MPCVTQIQCAIVWAMPSAWTFEIPPIADFVARWTAGCDTIVDPFRGRSTVGTIVNDIAESGQCSVSWLDHMVTGGVVADAVLFDPPYSPRQIAEHYRAIGKAVTKSDTQISHLHSKIRVKLNQLLRPGGVALSFGWNSSGLGKSLVTEEILLVRHGGSHNDTICVAQRKPMG